MRGKFEDLTGQQFGQWTVQKRTHYPNASKAILWQCQCSCGTIQLVQTGNLRSGLSTKCTNCRNNARITHGHTKQRQQSPTYSVYRNMIRRCTDPNNKDWPNYGGRGITVCKRWQKGFEFFLQDMGEKPKNLTLERKNNNRGYTPSNCTWIPKSQQSKNRRKQRT